jgi:LPXTG-motif cell wall-anchored protein
MVPGDGEVISRETNEKPSKPKGLKPVRTWIKLAVLSALMVMVLALGAGVAGAQTTSTTLDPNCYPVQTANCIDPNAGNTGAGQATGLPRTGSSSSVPTAAIAAGMVAVGSVLAIGARRRSTARRSMH